MQRRGRHGPQRRRAVRPPDGSLDGITAQLARCFDQKIIITDPELAGVRFYAFFTNNESLLKILGTLNTDKSMSIRERNDVIYISRKK